MSNRSPERADVVDRKLAELEFDPAHLGGKAGLVQVVLIRIDRDHALGAAPLHLDRVESGIAADVEDGPAAQICGQRIGETAPLHRWVITEEVLRGGLDAAQIEIVKPFAELAHAPLDRLRGSARSRAP